MRLNEYEAAKQKGDCRRIGASHDRVSDTDVFEVFSGEGLVSLALGDDGIGGGDGDLGAVGG